MGAPHAACPTAAASGIQRDADSTAAAAADTGRLAVRTPGITPDAWTHRSPGHRTSARPVGRTSAWRTADADRATNGVADVRTPSAATTIATAGWAAQTSLGLQRLRCSAADDRLCTPHLPPRCLGSCAALLDRKPRLGALLSSENPSCVGMRSDSRSSPVLPIDLTSVVARCPRLPSGLPAARWSKNPYLGGGQGVACSGRWHRQVMWA
jgi:hypothetical protein